MTTIDNLDPPAATGHNAAPVPGGALAALSDPDVRADPYPLLAALREASPFPTPDGAMVVVGRHADCGRILRDPAVSSDRTRTRVFSTTPRRRPSFLFLDPPDHTRLRRLVSKAFTPRVIAALEPRIRAVVDELLAAADPAAFDVIAGLSYPLPVGIISEMLGVPESDREKFAGWSDRLAQGLDPQFVQADPGLRRTLDDTRDEFMAYFADLIAVRRGRAGDDLLSHLIRVEEDGDQLTEEDLLATCVLLLIAGHETTTNLIGNGILALLRHPDQLAELRADPSLVPGAVEESLRYDAPVQISTRIVRGSYRLGEIEAPDGAVLVLLLAAAGRDPDTYADPDRFDIRRAVGTHLAFAAGPHFCLGAGLARLEAAVALEAFATRVADPELTEVVYKPNVTLRGPARLVVGTGGIT